MSELYRTSVSISLFFCSICLVPVQLCDAALLDDYPPTEERGLLYNSATAQELNASTSRAQIRLNYRSELHSCSFPRGSRNRLRNISFPTKTKQHVRNPERGNYRSGLVLLSLGCVLHRLHSEHLESKNTASLFMLWNSPKLQNCSFHFYWAQSDVNKTTSGMEERCLRHF